jgi:hypothetical protein
MSSVIFQFLALEIVGVYFEFRVNLSRYFYLIYV